jgi:DNA-binding IclR family transcriptional regulator
VTPGLGSVAVAVLDHNDYPVAGVAVTYPQADVDGEAAAAIVVAVKRAASSLSARLGRPAP